VRVLVDAHGLVFVGQAVDRVLDCSLGHDVAHVERVQQRRAKRREVVGRQRRDAVVFKLELRRDQAHVVRVLAGDDAVVAAHVLQAEHPGDVGVGGVGPRRVQRRDPERPFLRVPAPQPFQRGRREVQQGGIRRRVKARRSDQQIEGDGGHRQRRPERQPSQAGRQRPRPAAEQEHRPGQQQEDAQQQDVGELVAVEHPRIGEGVFRQRQGAQRPVDQRLKPGVEDIAAGQRQQDQAARAGQNQTESARQAIGGPPRQRVRPEPGQYGDGQRQGEDPAKRAVQLVDARQQVVEHGVGRQAEDEGQGNRPQSGEDRPVRPPGGQVAFCAPPPGPEQRVGGQRQRQDAQVRPALDVVLDPPVDGRDRLAQGVGAGRDHLAAEHVEVGVVGRVAEEVGHQEGEQPPLGIGPAEDLLQRGRAFPEVLADQLDQGDDLRRAEQQARADHDHQPDPAPQQPARRPAFPPGRPPSGQQPPDRVEGHDQQRVIQDLDVPGVDDQGQRHGPGRRPGQRGRTAEQRLAPDHVLDHQEQEGQPGRRALDHGEDRADQEEAAELPAHRRDRRPDPPLAQPARQGQHGQPGDPELDHGVPAV